MSTDPPSLAARLEQTGPLHWREAARLTARVARALDRLHAQRPAHGGIEPLTVLFVGGTVRLADPLPPESRDPAFGAPPVADGEPADRQRDFFALGRLMATMVVPEPTASPELPSHSLPPPLAAVQRRLVTADPSHGYKNGNDIAAALELAIAASEGFAATVSEPRSPPGLRPDTRASAPTEPPTATPTPNGAIPPTSPMPPPAAPTGRVSRRRRPRAVLVLSALLVLGALAVLWLRPSSKVAIERPAGTTEPPPLPSATSTVQADGQEAAAPSSPSEAAEEWPLERVLATLPDMPQAVPPAEPATRVAVEALLAGQRERPCTRLEVEPSSLGLRLVGSTASAEDRTELLAAIGALDDLDEVSLGLDEASRFCRLYDMLAAHTEPAMPRLADLFPSRPDYRLAGGEPLVLRVLTPDFPSHLMVDYFTADGMVVHLAERRPAAAPAPPVETVWIGDPSDGQWLTIAEPYGHELIAVIASREPLFAEPRSRIEPAEAYLEALEAVLAERGRKPTASTVAIRTSPPDN